MNLGLAKETIYEIDRIFEQHGISRHEIEISTTTMPHLFDGIVINMARRIAKWKPSGAVLVIKKPANWWQHFKLDHFPTWALLRWPVLFHTEVYQAEAFLPDVPVMHHGDRIFYNFRREEK